jgi:hypothetical protein
VTEDRARAGEEVEKPKGRRWAAVERRMDRVGTVEAVCDANLVRFVLKLSQRQD